MRVVVGGDHAGFPLKQKVVARLKAWGHDVEDIGTFSEEPVDFPDVAEALCRRVTAGEAQRGILVCGTGVGAAIAANKYPGIRAAVCHDVFSAHQCVEHDDVNVMCIGAWIVGEMLAYELVAAYLVAVPDQAPEFRRRIAKLHEMESRLRPAPGS
ncbi:ribose 5-phosphate isomerase B [Geochorda subterranea]|uniref:Ribose 5-phosphate isomerase B n=1 Tax=Geochorda subterranea TaxID=3109564 RepID=A0ABZ1BT63_9FIRM|nr:ribose 5-phosphate isomerase B [Limnochorda sp. LNt]WRP15650.1 ribose 5-phosphate isomerase B [Limnochorda sp. LNt]